MNKDIKKLGILVSIVIFLGITYMVIPKNSFHSGNSVFEESEAESAIIIGDNVIDNDQELKKTNGTPAKGGMDWMFSSDELVDSTYASIADFDELTVFNITNHHEDELLDNLQTALNLEKDDTSLYYVGTYAFYFENSSGNAFIHRKDVPDIINELHIGVWNDNKNFGVIRECKDDISEMTFSFHDIPWIEDYRGDSLSEDESKNTMILVGVESKHDLFWEFNDENNLTKFSGFSFEVNEEKRARSIASINDFYKIIENALEEYEKNADEQDENLYHLQGKHSIYEKFTINNIQIYYAREIDWGNSDRFVPVIILEGDRNLYYFSEDKWCTLVDAGYAISMESGIIYDWRKD